MQVSRRSRVRSALYLTSNTFFTVNRSAICHRPPSLPPRCRRAASWPRQVNTSHRASFRVDRRTVPPILIRHPADQLSGPAYAQGGR